MADELSVLFKIRGDAAGGKRAVEETRQAIASLRETSSGDLARMGQAGARSLQQIESAIASVKQRIKEVKAEAKGDIGFKTERLEGLRERLKGLVAEQKALAAATKDSAKAFESDLSGALQAISPRLASLAAAGGPITLAAIGVAALAAGAAVLAKELYDLTAASADFQGKLFDLSQQTGINVETLSALEVLARTTGGNIDSIAASLGIFQKNLEDAQDASTKMAERFKTLGINSTDTEEALRQTLQVLNKMPEGFNQTAIALELFGRGGKQMLAILKESHGDLDKAIARFKELGILVSGDVARAADQFNDEMAILSFQIRALGAELTKELLPKILEGTRNISEFTKENKDLITNLGILIGIAGTVVGWLVKFNLEIRKPGIALFVGLMERLAEHYERIAAASQIITGNIPTITGNEIPAQPTTGGDVDVGAGAGIGGGVFRKKGKGGGRRARITRDTGDAEAKRQEDQELAFFQNLVESLKRTRDELNNVDVTTRSYATEQAILNGVLKDASPAFQELTRQQAQYLDNATKQLQLQNSLRAFLVEQEEQIKRATEGTVDQITVTNRFIESLEKQGAVLQSATKFGLRFNAALLQALDTATKFKQIVEDISKILPMPGADGVPEIPGVDPKNLPQEPPPPPVPFDVWKNAFKELKDIGRDALDSLAQGVGTLVANWVLLGETGPAAMRKLVASVLAGVAAQAAVKAIYELAEGFAALFFNPAAAAAHFKAAALFGAVAGVAAAAGRAVAGNAFQRQGGGASGSGGGGTGQLNPLTLGRNQPQPQRIILQIQSNDSHIVKVIQGDYRTGGTLRELILEDGGV